MTYVTAEMIRAASREGAQYRMDVAVASRFRCGDVVLVRNINPTGHTRLPRYARGRIGRIERDHGVFGFPDTNAHHLGQNPQHVYSVRFTARALWGDQASDRDTVFLDLWDDHLDPFLA